MRGEDVLLRLSPEDSRRLLDILYPGAVNPGIRLSRQCRRRAVLIAALKLASAVAILEGAFCV